MSKLQEELDALALDAVHALVPPDPKVAIGDTVETLQGHRDVVMNFFEGRPWLYEAQLSWFGIRCVLVTCAQSQLAETNIQGIRVGAKVKTDFYSGTVKSLHRCLGVLYAIIDQSHVGGGPQLCKLDDIRRVLSC